MFNALVSPRHRAPPPSRAGGRRGAGRGRRRRGPAGAV